MWTFTRPGMFNDVLHVHEIWPQFLAPELRLQHFPGVKQSSWQQWPGVPGASMGKEAAMKLFPPERYSNKGAFQPFQPPKSGDWSNQELGCFKNVVCRYAPFQHGQHGQHGYVDHPPGFFWTPRGTMASTNCGWSNLKASLHCWGSPFVELRIASFFVFFFLNGLDPQSSP